MTRKELSLNKLDINNFVKKKVLLIPICNYQLYSVRLFHSIIEEYTQVKTVFLNRNLFTIRNTKTKPSEKEYDILIKIVKEFDPGMVGISFSSFYFPVAKEITRRIKGISNALIVWGGVHSILCPDECIKYADMVCIGEGGIPIRNLFEKKSLEGFWINQGGKIYKSSKRSLTKNWDELPLPNVKDENKYYIDDNELGFGDPINMCRVYDVLASIGCPFNCTYCVNSVLKELYKGRNLLRSRSVDNVIAELKTIKKESKSLKRIFFLDEIFGLGNKKWIKEFAKRYKKEIGLPFGVEFRPDWINESILMVLKDAGLDNVVMGLESVSERVRKEVYLRNVSDEQILKCQKILKKVGVIGTYNLMVKNPLETVEDLKKGFDFVIKFQRPFSYHIYNLTNFPKTKLTERLISEGMIKESDLNDIDYAFTPSRDGEEDFWINLIILSSKEFIPKKFLIFLSKRKYFIKNQFFIYWLVRGSNFIKLMMDGVRWASREGFSYNMMRTVFKNLKGYLKMCR